MKNILLLFLLGVFFSCTRNEIITEEGSAQTSSQREKSIIDKGVIYPSTNSQILTRTNYNDLEVDWVNGTKVTLPNGEEVDLPWINGGDLLPFMKERLSPSNGWELIAHTMRPDTESNRSYLIFHNYITGTLRVFCYMSTFVNNNMGYWTISTSQPTRLFNFLGNYALPMNQYGPTKIVISNCTIQDGKGFSLGWNGFQMELAYDPSASGTMNFSPSCLNATNFNFSGTFSSQTEGTIVGTESQPSVGTQIISGLGKIAGDAAEEWLGSILSDVDESNSRSIGSTALLTLAQVGITGVFKAFSGLFNKQTQKIYDVSLTTQGTTSMTGYSIQPSAAPIGALDINLSLIDGKLGGWNLEESPIMTWWTTAFNEIVKNESVTNREYIYEVPQPQMLSYNISANPKSNFGTRKSQMNYYYRSPDIPDYDMEGNMLYRKDALCYDYGIKYQYKGSTLIVQPRMRVHVRYVEYPTSEMLPFTFYLTDLENRYRVVEWVERGLNPTMDLYLQVSCNNEYVINGVTNTHIASRIYQIGTCNWGSEY
ncbi:hypothetical protein [Phocaeicola plebeius]|jgi:hypothetical protein|uniref:hypothetical protein n=1 Tax=Phocaeicola plebeius TaxID=310297 RepID=UPI0026DBE763|nr:hypothetical protein [Phocaeicola plebeius]